jgi:hypothetical protein
MKLGTETGSFYNHLYSGCPTLPEVGKGATKLYWTDREPYDVVWVSQNKKECLIRPCLVTWDKEKGGGMGHQNWIIEPDHSAILTKIVFRHNRWKQVIEERCFTEEAEAKYNALYEDDKLSPTERNAVIQAMYVDESNHRLVTRYNRLNIIFGVQMKYHDWEF